MAGTFKKFEENNLEELKIQLQSTEYIFWDSGFLIKLLDKRNNDPKTRTCKALYSILKTEQLGIYNITCDFVIEEVINYVISKYYKNLVKNYSDKGIKYDSWTALYKEQPELIQNCLEFIYPLYQIINSAPVLIHRPLNDIESEVLKLIKEYNLCAMDAYILAAMMDAEIEDLITTDVKDMKRIKDSNLINIYSCYNEPLS